MINRSAVVVRPAQPFIEWVANLAGATALPRVDDEPTVYLVPPFDDEAQGLAMLEEAFPALFERELNGWCTDDALWPADRDYRMFRAWFQIVLLSRLEDVCEGGIVDESELDDAAPPDA